MTKEEQSALASTIAAHERILSILLAEYLSKATAAQRMELVNTMSEPQSSVQEVKPTSDLDTVDRVAGPSIGYNEAVVRIVGSAMAELRKD